MDKILAVAHTAVVVVDADKILAAVHIAVAVASEVVALAVVYMEAYPDVAVVARIDRVAVYIGYDTLISHQVQRGGSHRWQQPDFVTRQSNRQRLQPYMD